MNKQSGAHRTGKAIASTFLFTAILFILVLIKGSEKWIFVGLLAAPAIIMLIPILRDMYTKGRS